jgi:hypothetical protein
MKGAMVLGATEAIYKKLKLVREVDEVNLETLAMMKAFWKALSVMF